MQKHMCYPKMDAWRGVTLVDTNVLLNLVTNDPNWADWSIAQLEAQSLNGPLLINDAVYAELGFRYGAHRGSRRVS